MVTAPTSTWELLKVGLLYRVLSESAVDALEAAGWGGPGGRGRGNHSWRVGAGRELISRPTLIVVSGPAGSGKTTLAHRLAAAVGCPALCRDELKEGMVAATPGFVPFTSDPLTLRTYDLLLHDHPALPRARRDPCGRSRIPALRLGARTPLRSLAALRIVRCHVDPEVARIRAEQRAREQPSRSAHDDIGHFAIDQPSSR